MATSRSNIHKCDDLEICIGHRAFSPNHQRQIDVLFVSHALEECSAFFALNKLLQRDFNRDAMSLAGEVLG